MFLGYFSTLKHGDWLRANYSVSVNQWSRSRKHALQAKWFSPPNNICFVLVNHGNSELSSLICAFAKSRSTTCKTQSLGYVDLSTLKFKLAAFRPSFLNKCQKWIRVDWKLKVGPNKTFKIWIPRAVGERLNSLTISDERHLKTPQNTVFDLVFTASAGHVYSSRAAWPTGNSWLSLSPSQTSHSFSLHSPAALKQQLSHDLHPVAGNSRAAWSNAGRSGILLLWKRGSQRTDPHWGGQKSMGWRV